MDRVDFLDQAKKGAAEARNHDAPIMPVAAAVHAAHETGFGSSMLSQPPHHNLFGVKATGSHTPYWDGAKVVMQTWEVINGRDQQVNAAFRSYRSYEHAYGDYGDVIRRVYPHAAAATRDLDFLAGLFITGPRRWATDPRIFDATARLLAYHSQDLYGTEVADGRADILVLHRWHLRDRWRILWGGDEAILRMPFYWRVRRDEGVVKVDIRRA